MKHTALNPQQPDSPLELEPLVIMTCAEYLDHLDMRLCTIIDEAYWEGEGGITDTIEKLAAAEGIILTDEENLDKECHNAWKCAEKGLS